MRQLLALALFMAWVVANDEHHPTAAHDLALLANSLDAGADLHNLSAFFRP
jgi:hypothetical protein